jgi:two-component system response regulator DegU
VEALELLLKSRADVVIADIDMPKMGGLELARSLAQRGLRTRVVLLTMHKKESFLTEALQSGVLGYVLKDNAVLDIIHCLRAVMGGETYISPTMASFLARRAHDANELMQAKPALAQLTAMERRILRLVAGNKTTKEIAKELFISHFTVETHRRNICEKLDLHGSHRLLQFALEHRAELCL